MKNEAGSGKSFYVKFLVLVPHRDARALIRKHCELLIKEGVTGVYLFPWVAPIAELSEEFSSDELKYAAHSLRDFTGTEKFPINETASAAFPSGEEKMILFGQRFDLKIPDSIFGEGNKKIKKLFAPLVIGSLLMPKANEQRLCAANQRIEAPLREKISFRSAALANMYWKPIKSENEYVYRWKIGKLSWLPNR